MQILDEAEQPMPNGTVIGPLSEGQRLTSYCEARGGRPAPIVTWYSNGEKLHSKFRIIIAFHYYVNVEVCNVLDEWCMNKMDGMVIDKDAHIKFKFI